MDAPLPASPPEPPPVKRFFYLDALQALDDAKVPYLVGGGYAMAHYTGVPRPTKDLDIFVRPADRDRCLTTLTAAGYKTEFFYPFWISKALHGESFIDILYSSGNGVCTVDDDWFEHAIDIDVHGYPAKLTPIEETMWSKAFVMDRDRFDGGDVLNLILCQSNRIDWDRLIGRFAKHEPVLLAHLTLFGYVFPTDRDRVPAWAIDRLTELTRSYPVPNEKVCQGTFLAQRSYGAAVREWGYADGRLRPHGPLTPEQLAQLPEP